MLHEILDDIYLEYACAYVFYYNMILNLKDQGQLTQTKQDSIEEMVKNYTNQKDEFICKKYKISTVLLEEWLLKKKNDR